MPNQQNKQIIEVVALALRNTVSGRFLLARRKAGGSGAGEWEFPGGKLEVGESPQAGLVREIQEELLFDLSGRSLFRVGSHVHNYSGRLIRIELWLAEVDFSPEFQLVDHDEVNWYELSQMSEVNLSEGDKTFISLLNSYSR
ncbi:(deoxy)nucleoside triphosphate pyrophosphohydrolase [Pseudobdellovibrio exovorus]|nr:NUDIX domain-containing protein [Pseudobdellovibrio exovorus]